MNQAAIVPARPPSSPLAAIVVGGLVAGVLDILSAIVAYAPGKTTIQQVLQSVASGAIGPSAYEGGWGTAMLGLFLHFVIAFGATLVFYLASRAIRFMTQHPVAAGLIYGEIVFVVMQFVIIPLSAIGWRVPDFTRWQTLLTGPVGHLVLVGLPISLAVHRFAPHPDVALDAPRPAVRTR